MRASLSFHALLTSGPTGHWRGGVVLIRSLAAAVVLSACSESPVPYFTAPTSVPNSTTGVQNAITGLFGGMRTDRNQFLTMANAFARDAMVFVNVDPPLVTEFGGEEPINGGDVFGPGGFSIPFQYAKQADEIISILPQVPAYSTAQVAAVTGVAQTMKALNFMLVAELRDTLGIPIYAISDGSTSPPYCNRDVWRYIVALLDSGLADLNTAGTISLPISLPAGYASVGATAAPSTNSGAFAAFNRALAGKAGLELAYAAARNLPATSPTPASPGAPDAAALTRADSALNASALYNLATIGPPAAGPFALDAYGVYETYSGQSGDLVNPMSGNYAQLAPMQDLFADVDTADLRWKNKFVPAALALQLPEYSVAAVDANYLPYATPSSPVPVVRAEELALVRAEIRLGLGDYGGAIALINTVHQQAGGLPALAIAPSYTAVRDTLMKELRISTVLEGSADHLIAIRMWGMAAVSDTTWAGKSGPDAQAVAAIKAATNAPPGEYHTTVAPIPVAEIQSRGGTYTPSCP